MLQIGMFAEVPATRQPLPVLGDQKDIRYFGTTPKSVLNGPGTTGMGWWSINPYVGCAFGCAYCYARYAHRYVGERLAAHPFDVDGEPHSETDELPPWLAFERRIFVKRDAGLVLRRALARPAILAGLRRDGVVIGTATDPYQPAERRFRLTRSVLEALAEHSDLTVTIITKSPLVTRDLDLLTRIAERSRISVHVSLITVDRELARRLEPRAPTPEARLRGIARLRAAGIEVGVNVMPVLPGITDAPEMIDALVRAVAAANASYVGACALRLRRTARDRYIPFIEAEFPALAGRYRRAYAHGHQVNERYREGLRERFAAVCAEHGVAYGRYHETTRDGGENDEEGSGTGAAIVASADPGAQLVLELGSPFPT
jgi:DNA repair photolyase